jgi:type IV pilus assembly protein PilM
MANGIFTGIDIGSDTVKVISLRRRGTRYEALGAGLFHRSPDDADEDPSTLAKEIGRLVRTHRIPVGRVVVGLGGKGSLIRCLSQPVCPRWKLAMLIAYEVELQAGAGDAAYDFHPLDLPEYEEGQFGVLLAQSQSEVVSERLEIARKATGRSPTADMNCLGPFNLYAASPAAQRDEQTISLLLDIGADETTVSVQQGDALYFARPLSGGGRRFTNRISGALNVGTEAAEQAKLESDGILQPPSEYDVVDQEAEAISTACKTEATALASAVMNSLNYFKTQIARSAELNGPNEKLEAIQPEKIYLTGGGSLLPGLDTFISQRTGLPVEHLELEEVLPRRRRSAEIALEDQPDVYAAAAGLALARARPQGFTLDIIPEQEQERRRFRERTIYTYAAAAVAIALLVLSVIDARREARVARISANRWTQQYEKAKELNKEIQQERSQNQRLAEKVEGLRIRRNAGAQTLRLLALLRRVGKEHPEFFFTSIDMPSLYAAPQRSGTSRRGRGRDRREEEAQASPRTIRLQGYCSDVTSANEGLQKVTSLVDALPALGDGLIESVEQESGEWVDDPEQLIAYYTGPGEVHEEPTPGPAFAFTLTCRLR